MTRTTRRDVSVWSTCILGWCLLFLWLSDLPRSECTETETTTYASRRGRRKTRGRPRHYYQEAPHYDYDYDYDYDYGPSARRVRRTKGLPSGRRSGRGHPYHRALDQPDVVTSTSTSTSTRAAKGKYYLGGSSSSKSKAAYWKPLIPLAIVGAGTAAVLVLSAQAATVGAVVTWLETIPSPSPPTETPPPPTDTDTDPVRNHKRFQNVTVVQALLATKNRTTTTSLPGRNRGDKHKRRPGIVANATIAERIKSVQSVVVRNREHKSHIDI